MDSREINESDLRGLAVLFTEAFNAEPWNDKWSEELAYQRLRDVFLTPGFVGVVAIEDNQITGGILGHLEWWYEGRHFNLKEFFVDRKIQGKGIGSYLLEELSKRLEKEKVGSINLLTLNSAETIGFYEKNQYRLVEEMVIMKK